MPPSPIRQRLLIIDDEPDYLEALRINLSAEFDVTAVDVVHDFGQVLSSALPDIILCDVNMTPLDGFSLRRSIVGSAWEKIPFLFLTGRTEVADRIRGFELGADDYITKPTSSAELSLRLRRVLNRRSLGLPWGMDADEGFIHRLRHEVKTPLVAAGLALQSIAAATPPADARSATLHDSLDCLQSLGSLLDDLLMLVSLDQNALRFRRISLDPSDTIRGRVTKVEHTWRSRGHRVQVQLASDARAFLPSPGFELLCHHLLDNAFKFSPPRSAITVVYTTGPGGAFRLDVTNSGVTIPAEIRPRIFDRFFQRDSSATREHPGLGLGLHLCSVIALRTGGQLRPIVTDTSVTMALEYPPVPPGPENDEGPAHDAPARSGS